MVRGRVVHEPEGTEMSARKKLNGLYVTGTVVFAAFIGALFASWWAFAVAFAATAYVQVMAGNIRFVAGHR
jgi:hypothetical protein